VIGFSEFGEKVKYWRLFFSIQDFMAEGFAISFVMTRVSFRVFRNSYSPLTCSFKSLWSRMRFLLESDYLRASFSGRVFSASVATVSMSLVLRGAKKLRVITVLVGSLPAADFGADIVDFLTVCEVSLDICLCVSLLPGNRHHVPLFLTRFWSLLHIVLPAHSPSGLPSVHSVLVCICRRERLPF
jgi:hypothetical protein